MATGVGRAARLGPHDAFVATMVKMKAAHDGKTEILDLPRTAPEMPVAPATHGYRVFDILRKSGLSFPCCDRE